MLISSTILLFRVYTYHKNKGKQYASILPFELMEVQCTFLLRAFREQIFMGMNNFADLDKMCSSLRRYRESNAPIVKGGIIKLIDDDEEDD